MPLKLLIKKNINTSKLTINICNNCSFRQYLQNPRELHRLALTLRDLRFPVCFPCSNDPSSLKILHP